MSRRQPPALALWLLDRLGFAGGNAPLIGDLLEEFRNGRSALWFWRQALTIVANSFARRAALLQIYWIALIAGLAAQLPLSLLLFRLHLPPPIHNVAGKIVGFVLMSIGLNLIPLLGRRVFGKTSKDAKLILLKPGGGGIQQPVLFGAAAFESFGGILLLYCLSCVLFSPALFSSFAEVVVCEVIWVGLGEVTSEISMAAAGIRDSRRTAAERERETRVWPHLNKVEVSLICSDGTTVLLRPETCMETIFASANEELIGAIFTRGVSLEEIRHAVWLAGAAEHGWPKTDPASMFEPAPVSRFVRLLENGTDSNRMKRYLEIPPARSSPKRPLT